MYTKPTQQMPLATITHVLIDQDTTQYQLPFPGINWFLLDAVGKPDAIDLGRVHGVHLQKETFPFPSIHILRILRIFDNRIKLHFLIEDILAENIILRK